jgi:hypothetical protein
MSAGLRLVEHDGTIHEVARLREHVDTLTTALDKMNRELITVRASAELWHEKYEASEARFIRRKKEQVTEARVQLVWDLWLLIRRGPASTTPIRKGAYGYELDEHREKLIKARLREGREIEEFFMAFYGADVWQNRSGKWMDTVDWVCKSAENFEHARDKFEWENADSWPYQGMNAVKAFADRRWARVEAMKAPQKAGSQPCERCGASIPSQEATGLCSGCIDEMKPRAA